MEVQTATNNRIIWPWALTLVVTVLAVVAWGQTFGWNLSSLDTYQIFPVLGLVAYSIMWAHYVTGSVKETVLKGVRLDDYFRITSYAVLLAIVLHPGLLIYQRFRDGYGLPPGSYLTYVAPSMAWIALLGTVSLLIFLAYELHRWFEDKPWWKYVLAAGDLAMVAIFYHGLRLGGQLQGGWYHYVWLFYGVVLAVILVQKYALIVRRKLQPAK